MKLTHLQWLYLLLGSAMNALSQIVFWQTAHYLTPTAPATGLLTMLALSACVLLQKLKRQHAFRFSMLIFAALLAYGGIYRHLLADAGSYYAGWARWAAIAINCLGVAVCLLGCFKPVKAA